LTQPAIVTKCFLKDVARTQAIMDAIKDVPVNFQKMGSQGSIEK